MMRSVVGVLSLLALVHSATATCLAESWNRTEDSHVSNGRRVSDQDDSLAQCQSVCEASASCIGIDWKKATPTQCWFTENPDVRITVDTTADHYSLQRVCSTGEDRDREVCTYQRAGVFRVTADVISTITVVSLETCADVCTAVTSCAVFSYRDSDKSCVTGRDLTGRTADATYTALSRLACSTTGPPPVPEAGTCSDEHFWEYPDQHVSGGELEGGVNTLHECRQACEGSVLCVGFDFTPNDACYLINNADTDITSDSSGTSHYRYGITCNDGDNICRYSYYGEYRYTSAILSQPTDTNLACLRRCSRTDDCVAVVISDSGVCQLVDSLETTDRVPDSGYVIWRLEECTGPPDAGTCGSHHYQTYSDQHVSGGELQSGLNTLSGCHQACDGTEACVGVDFTDSGACYLTNNPDTDITADSSGVSHYRYGITCNDGSYNCFFRYYGPYRYTSTVLRSLSTTAHSCRTTCSLDSDCVAVSISTSGNTCWLLSSLTSSDRVSDSRYIIYQKSNCTGTGPDPPDCLNRWEDRLRRSSFGGLYRASYTTTAACRDACEANGTCVGVDVNVASSVRALCYFHFDRDNFNTFRDTDDVNQYVITRCSEVCVHTWTDYADTSSPGGVYNASVTSVSTCQSACVDYPSCVAVDVDLRNSGSPRCYLHLEGDNLDITRNVGDINQYIIGRCTPGCVSNWTRTEGYHGFGGYSQRDISTLLSCQTACLALSTCTAIDYDSNSGAVKCWFYNTTDYNTGPYGGIDHYVLDRCNAGGVTTVAPPTVTPTPPDCVNIWSNYTNTNAPGAELQSAIDTLDECLRACVLVGACVGADVVRNAQCWLHLNPDAFSRSKTLDGVSQYRLTQRCGGPTITVTPTTVTTEASTTPDTECEPPLWDVRPDQHAVGGRGDSQYDTATSCRAACVSNPTCVAVDFDSTASGTKCYLHLSEDNLDTIAGMTGTTLYILTDRCPVDGCSVTWTNLDDTHASGGRPTAGANTLVECQNRCLTNTSCYGLDFDPPSCYLFYNRDDVMNTSPFSGVYHYVINRECNVCPQFEKYSDMHGFGGLPRANIDTEAACKAACVANMDCQGVDYDDGSTGTKCYLHAQQQAPDDLEPMDNTDHYDLLCRSGTLDTTLVSATPTTRASASPTSRPCQAQWYQYNHTHSGGGVLMGDYSSGYQCEVECGWDAGCLGFDVDYSGGLGSGQGACYWFSSRPELIDRSPMVNTYHYEKIRDCEGNVVGCVASWTPFVNQHGPGGSPLSDTASLDRCQGECVQDPDCVGADYKPSTSQCWLHADPGIHTRLETEVGVTFHNLTRCSDGEGGGV